MRFILPCLILFLFSTLSYAQADLYESDSLILKPDVPASPGCGFEGLYRRLLKTMRYPRTARKSGIQGTVYLSFVVNTDGTLDGFKVLKGIGGGCDEEAIRAIAETNLTCKWSAAMYKDHPVRCRFTVPIKFSL